MSTFEGIVVLNYKLTRKIGEGGFGSVYLAEHETLGRMAAVKILHPEFARNRGLIERFFNEAKAVCAIGHRAIIDIQNFGHLETGEPYYLMEFFPGQSLSERIDTNGPLSLTELATVLPPVVSALTAAHEKKIIHRDLKPENIMVLEEGGAIVDVKLLDFGIAKLIDDRTSLESKTGVAMGTPQFMAPEQARDSKNVDVRADVYSFGATVFNALCGRPPFVASNITDLILQIHTQEAPRLRGFVSGVSMELDEAVAQCLAKEPESRPPTIAEAWARISAACSAPATSEPSDLGTTATALEADSPAPPVQPAQESVGADSDANDMARGHASASTVQPASGRRGWRIAAISVLALGGVAAIAVTQMGRDAPETPAVADQEKHDAEVPADAMNETFEPIPSRTIDANAVTTTIDAALPESPCLISGFLVLYSEYKTVANAEAKLAELVKCHDEGKIAPDDFETLQAGLSKAIAHLRKSAP